MIDKALALIGIYGYSIEGNPSSELEFNNSFKKIIGADENGTAIFSNNPSDFGVTWNQILVAIEQVKVNELANAYKVSRASAYPSIQEQLDMQFWDAINGTTTWQDAINAVKTAHPKGQ